jgi:hypothetical protein
VHGLQVAGVLLGDLRRKRSAWSSASLSSEKPLAISRPPTKNSKRSVTKGSSSLSLASGETSVG